jgi:acetylornithine deacetylase
MAIDSGLRSALEERVIANVSTGREELTALAAELIAYDTTARLPGDPPRDEAELQECLRGRLTELGAEVDTWEPEPTGKGNAFLPDDLDFRGRPQLVARLAGSGGGRSLLLNGHVDVVSAEPLEQWVSDPFTAEVRDGRLYGRGSADMKGGIADMLYALQILARLGVRLAGDVVFCTNTDEESSGAGSYACVEHGVKADAGLCAEPTGFDAWIACRGVVNAMVSIEGRPGHSEMPHPNWREGGAVNAIEKLEIVLGAIRNLREDWRTRSDYAHALLSPASIVPTLVRGGEWIATYPSSCELTLDVQYLPAQVDAQGSGKAVFREVEQFVNAAAASDPWLAEHPLRWEWPYEAVPAEVSSDHPLVAMTLAASAAVGRPGSVAGLDSWHDPAVFTRRGGTPTISFGPDGINTAHTVNEHVMVDDLVAHAAAVALVLMRWCGVAGE